MITHHFSPAMLEKILTFDTAERTVRFVKDLQKTEIMQAGELPPPTVLSSAATRAQGLRSTEELYAPLGDPALNLKALAETQRKFWTSKQNADKPEAAQPVPPDAPEAPQQTEGPEPQAHFAPCTDWRLPSDYVAHLAKKFEAGPIDPSTKKRKPRKLKQD